MRDENGLGEGCEGSSGYRRIRARVTPISRKSFTSFIGALEDDYVPWLIALGPLLYSCRTDNLPPVHVSRISPTPWLGATLPFCPEVPVSLPWGLPYRSRD